MLDDPIPDKEILFRTIKDLPNWWNFNTNRPSTVAFKDPKGMSVDRAGNRTTELCISNLKNRFKKSLHAIVSITAGEVRKLDCLPLYSPSRRNIYHSVIRDSDEIIELSKTKALNLRNQVRIEIINN